MQKADFSLKIGRSDQWMDINYELDRDHIDVIPGEMSVLYSTITQEDGRDVHIKSKLLRENVLIGDFGYYTNDFCRLLFGNPDPIVSMTNFSMKEVFSRVIKKISTEYGEDIGIQALQQNLKTGVVVCTDEENLRREKKYFADILADANESVFMEAMDNLKIAVNYFRGYRYFIIAGGTGEAWFDQISKYLSKLNDLYVIPSNTSDKTIPLMYSVARGNYYYRYMKDQQ
ncbi:MAG: hypothetical protein LUF92_11670 [Clostridiales bacterium]|nr:hypothetical protein [Clostridiales bacterium]